MKKKIYSLIILAFLSSTVLVNAQNNALTFDGSNDYVSVSNINLNGLSSLTFETWVKPQSFNPQTGDNYISNLFGYVDADALLRIGDDHPGVLQENDRAQFVVNTSNGNGKCNAVTKMTANKWYHVAGTYDGSNMKIYINGILEATTAHTGNIAADLTTIIIGAQTGVARALDGCLEETRIWSTTRSETEIRQSMFIELQGNELGLLAYYKFNETSGSNLNDATSNNYNGSLFNMAGTEWITSSAFFGPKNCLDFDGVNDYVDCEIDQSELGSDFTISAWVYPETASNYKGIAGGHLDDGTKKGIVFCQYANGWQCGVGNGGNWSLITFPMDLNKWTYVTATYSSGNFIKIYLNGKLTSETTTGIFVPYTEFWLGKAFDNVARYYDGKIDEFSVWEAVLTETQIRENMCKSLTGTETGLVAYYNFDNTSGIALQDFSGNENDGTLTNMDNSDWVVSSAFNTWLNTYDTGWAAASNWSTGSVPASTDNVGIYNLSGSDPVLSSNLDCNNFFLETDASFTMNSGTSFFTTSNQFINGNFTIKKDIAQDSKWHLISAPNNNTTTSNFTGYYLQGWSEDTSGWYQISELDQAMPPVKGYSLFDIPAKTTLSFTGIPNTGEQTYSITYTDSDGSSDGMNLIGNPYPSAIDLNVIDPSYGAFHVWDPSTNDYEEYNGGTGNIRYLAPLQGFFVYSSSNETFTIDNNTRTHTGAGTFYKSSKSGIENGIVLSTNQQDKLYIKLMNEASDEFDFDYDAFKIISLGENNSQLYSKYFETKLAIDCRPETEIIQLGYQNNQNGQYSIEIIEIDGITDAEIEDTKLEKFHKLNSSAYVFDWVASDTEERFILHLKATGNEEMDAQDIQIYKAHGQVYVRLDEPNSYQEIFFFDLAGRVIMESNLSNQSLQNYYLGTYKGAILVQLKGKVKTKTKKVVL